MAYIGLRRPTIATVKTETPGQALEYNAGMRFGKAIAANVSWNRNENPLYADDAIAENDNGITGGTIEFNADDLSAEERAYALGLVDQTSGTGTSAVTTYQTTDAAAPYVGFGYIRVRRKAGVTSFQGIWYHKVQFAEGSENGQTKGQSIEWQTPTINGTIMGVQIDSSGAIHFREEQHFDTEAAAATWLDGKAGISA